MAKTEYVCTDFEGHPDTIKAATPLAAARRYFKDGEYGPDEERYKTYWVHIHVEAGPEDEPTCSLDFTFSVMPPVPPCEGHKRHRWTDEEVRAKGGGVAYLSMCRQCRCLRERTNWATDPHTGTQALDAVNYWPEENNNA